MKKPLSIIFVLVLLGGCAKNPFSSRDSEVPFEQAGTFIPPTSPQIVLENLKLAYGELVISNYMQSLDSSFVFSFDYLEGVTFDTAWGYNIEVNLTENLFNGIRLLQGAQSLDVQFGLQDDQQDIVLDTSATLVREYVVSVNDSLGNEIERYEGVAEFEMVESAFNYWTLLVWEDYHLETDVRSWGDLKSLYR